MDDNFCKKCEVGNMIDELTITEMNEDDECPICYKKLSLRYLHICSMIDIKFVISVIII